MNGGFARGVTLEISEIGDLGVPVPPVGGVQFTVSQSPARDWLQIGEVLSAHAPDPPGGSTHPRG